MLVTLALPTVPVPLDTVQFCPAGCDCTVTAYPPPDATGRGIVKLKLLAPGATFNVSEPLASTRPLTVRPLMVPPTAYDWPEQVTATLVMSAAAIVPLPLATLQVSPDGCA